MARPVIPFEHEYVASLIARYAPIARSEKADKALFAPYKHHADGTPIDGCSRLKRMPFESGYVQPAQERFLAAVRLGIPVLVTMREDEAFVRSSAEPHMVPAYPHRTVIIAGGRDYRHEAHIRESLDTMHAAFGPLYFRLVAATPCSEIVMAWAAEHDLSWMSYALPREHTRASRQHEAERNHAMCVDGPITAARTARRPAGADLVLVYPYDMSPERAATATALGGAGIGGRSTYELLCVARTYGILPLFSHNLAGFGICQGKKKAAVPYKEPWFR